MRLLKAQRPLSGVAVVLPVVAVGTALFTQHGLGMLPCPWCVLQRLIFLSIALVALPGVLLPGRFTRWASGLPMLALAVCGMAAALWQHFVAAASQSCAQTIADRVVRATGLDELLPEVFAAYASCADAAARLLGVPYEFYSLTLFTLLGAIALRVLGSRT